MLSELFLSWCASRGISTPLQLLESNGYRYMACESPLKAPATIIRAPLESCITADSTYALADRLAYERSLGSSSQYAPYIDILPTLEGSLAALPRFWSSSRIEKVKDGYQLIKKAELFEDKGLDPWALACVNSRCNYLQGGSYSLTPLLDMLNHDGSVRTSASIAVGELFLQVHCSFAAGNEVFISYGDLTNLDTLWDYGFVTADNPYNAETVEVQIIRQPSLKVTVAADGSIQNSALTSLRRYLATTKEVDEQRQSGDNILAFSKPISERNEMEVFAFLATELNEAATEAKSGAREAEEDDLVRTYLHERSKTLQKGLDAILDRYPDLEY